MLAFLLRPIAVYMVTWVPWFHHFGWSWHAWVENLGATWRFHQQRDRLDGSSIRRPAWRPRPTRTTRGPEVDPAAAPDQLLREGHTAPSTEQVSPIGNPFIFWGSVVAIPSWLSAVATGSATGAGGSSSSASLGQYLPWFLLTRPTFFFYVLPLTPFMVLAVTYIAGEASDATIVVREPDTGEVAMHPETG